MGSNDIITILQEGAANIIQGAIVTTLTDHVQKAQNTAKGLAPTKRLKENIEIVPMQQTLGHAVSGLLVSTEKAPEACAYEFGSGLHDPAGGHTIRIPGKNSTGPVAFKWDKAEKMGPKGAGNPSLGRDGRYVFSYVNHPGVVARPYLKPAAQAEMEPLMQDLVKITDSILGPDKTIITLHFNFG